MGKLMDFFSRSTYKKAKKNVFKNIYRNLKCDENFKLFYKDYKKTECIKYLDRKHEAKEIYRKLINGDSEKLLEEKERMSVNVQSISFPYSSMVMALGIGIIPNIITGMANVAFPDNNSKGVIISIISVIYLLVVFIFLGQLIIGFEKEAFICTTCLKALEELEEEFKANKEDIKNKNDDEVVKKIATTVEVHEGSYKEKRNMIIKGLFKKQNKFERDKKSQEELAQEFEKLKSLNQEELVVRKGWYSREAKNCRDIAKNIKNILNMVTIILTILSVIIPVYTQVINKSGEFVNNSFDRAFKIIQHKDIGNKEKEDAMFDLFNSMYGKESKDVNGYNEINILEDTFKTAIGFTAIIGLGSIFMIYFISMHSSKYNNRASHYETLAEYIDNELIKNDETKN